jgi:hypothetical protein
MGELVSISDTWTKNGDGSIVILVGRDMLTVKVVGSPPPGSEPTTEIILKHAATLEDLLHKDVIVCGDFNGSVVTATAIKEP